MGVTVGTIAVTVLENIEAGFHKGFFEGLVAIGKGLLQILKAVAEIKLTALPIAFAVGRRKCAAGIEASCPPSAKKPRESRHDPSTWTG